MPKENIRLNEPLKDYTSFKIGGPADALILPPSIEVLGKVIRACQRQQVPFYIIGNGSNLLVDDEGLEGIVIQLYRNFAKIEVEGNYLIASSGALLSKIATVALEHSLTGLEFAHGIPGTLGGAVAMNAGAYGGEMKDVLVSSLVMDQKGEIFSLSKEELELGYRTSKVQREGYIVLEATLELNPGEKKKIQECMKDLSGRRREKQPLDKPSAGSTFKRPEGHFAGKLIMDAGLRGYQIGGALVSEKHCGFIVNDGTATYKDVCMLIKAVQRIVGEKFGVQLEPEVRILTNKR
ncbi:UDP-N-acetylenolpyruvoylglucosamine reductase [Sporanaerobium hydrogeniformans]|uniref:UDP-N-acetylenolpyruvoylglucosamine reductase n=1 Tax=Sporanaerobium hydrogeniformans TaxID=3072179 RepID=A0AC61DF10_9FIRM|nr:UDP-N-acetylenolpyruvoylglucosamine reductase [Sporanaerobium hydrogeniformans]